MNPFKTCRMLIDPVYLPIQNTFLTPPRYWQKEVHIKSIYWYPALCFFFVKRHSCHCLSVLKKWEFEGRATSSLTQANEVMWVEKRCNSTNWQRPLLFLISRLFVFWLSEHCMLPQRPIVCLPGIFLCLSKAEIDYRYKIIYLYVKTSVYI